ncbi:MAG: hypothetical protein ACR2G2_09075 [Pseudonocardia sp.]
MTVTEKIGRAGTEPIVEPASRRRPWWGHLVAAGVPTAMVAVHAARYGQWIEDDAGITFAFARSLANGAGPVLQPGADPVEAFSNPAWLAILVAGRLLHLFDSGTWFGVPDLVLFPKVVALALCFGTFSCCYTVARAVSRHPVRVTVAAGAVTACVPAFVIWTVSGLENSLTTLAVVALAAMLARAAVAGRLLDPRTAIGCGALAGLAALTRPDGLVYAAAYPLAALLLVGKDSARQTVASIAVSVLTVSVPVGGYLAWRVATFGDYLPNTARAKEQGIPTLSDLDKPAALVGYVGWLACMFTVGVVAVALHRRSPTRTGVAMLLIPLGLAVLAYAVLATDWMAQYRFTTPVWPLASLVLALSAAQVLRGAATRTRIVAVVTSGLVGGLTLVGWYGQSETFRRAPTVSACYIARNTGYTFNTYADLLGIDQGSLLAVDGGGTSLTSRLRFVDLSGLADARIARYWHTNDMVGLRDHVFEQVRPTFIRIWSGWDGVARSGILADPRLGRDYVLVWGPPGGGGNWVRRDAVPSAGSLDELRRLAPELAAMVDAPYDRIATHWWCPATLRPSVPGASPALDLPR